MAISDKLNYLIETKQLFKDRLNSLGAEITSSTTFRNYLTWLDTFYGEVSDKTDLSQNGVVGRTSQNTAILPSEYTQVDYIRSTGGQYIDTGINADTNLRTILDISFINPTNANQTMGAINIGTPNKRYHLLSGSNSIAFWVNDANYGIINSASTDRHLWDLNVPEGKVVLDNTTTTTIPTNIANVEMNFWLFGRNSNATQYKGTFKLWACKMYYNGTLVRDFIPCYRNSDNEIGLYDLVNNVFYINQGTGAFIYDSVASLPNPDYPQPINNLSGDVAYKVSGKNKLPFPYTESTHTHNGVTFTVNNDGSVLVNGTATGGNANTKLYGNHREQEQLKLPSGYLYGGTTNVWLRALNNHGGNYSLLGNDTGEGAEIDTTTYDVGYVELTVKNGTTVNNQLIKPMVLDSLEDTSYEPYILQTFNIPLKSKNLFDKDSANILYGYISGANFTLTDAGGTNRCVYIECQPNTTYAIQKKMVDANRFRIGTSENIPTASQALMNTQNSDTEDYIILTTSSNSHYIILHFYNTASGVTINEVLASIQIEENSTATDYEPYYDIELCKIDTYEDKIYSSNGRFYLEKKIGKVVLNGSEYWNIYNSKVYYSTLNLLGINALSLLTISTHFISSKAKTTMLNNHLELYPSEDFRTRYPDVSSFKQWLSTNNITLYYELATPTTTEITQENYPSLYNALKQIQDYLTAYKINKEFILGYSSPEIEY